MKILSRWKLIIILAFFAGVVAIGSYVLLASQSKENKPAAVTPDKFFGWRYPVVKFPIVGPEPTQLAYSDIRDPGGIPQGLPVRLQIPSIGVNSAIEDALITIDGRMDVPAGSQNVAWFALGPHPGQEGSAVIGGHFGIQNGKPFVFYDLDKLNVGDKIYVVNDKNETLAFVVRSVKLFDRNADATDVFTSHDNLAHLNLITCEGAWNQVNGSYPERRVVFTDAIPKEGLAPVFFVFLRSLDVGARGADVAALQTILAEKGLLTMPPGVAKGYFGAVTRAAVARYQTSVGISPVGIFGPLTRARLIRELGSKLGLPNTAVGTNRDASLSSSQTLASSLKDLYATPIDGLITLLLLVLIAFTTFKIIRR